MDKCKPRPNRAIQHGGFFPTSFLTSSSKSIINQSSCHRSQVRQTRRERHPAQSISAGRARRVDRQRRGVSHCTARSNFFCPRPSTNKHKGGKLGSAVATARTFSPSKERLCVHQGRNKKEPRATSARPRGQSLSLEVSCEYLGSKTSRSRRHVARRNSASLTRTWRLELGLESASASASAAQCAGSLRLVGRALATVPGPAEAFSPRILFGSAGWRFFESL